MSVICHHQGKYNLYSTISDGFIFESALTYEQLEEYIRKEQGEVGLRSLVARVRRAQEDGTSSLFSYGLDGLISCNRAGENEAHLSTEECIKRFLS